MLSQYRPGLDISELSLPGRLSSRPWGSAPAEAVRDMYARGEEARGHDHVRRDDARGGCRPEKHSSRDIRRWKHTLGGASMLSVPGGPFHDAESDAALYESIMEGLEGTDISIVQDEGCINDRDFAVKIAEAMAKLMGLVCTSPDKSSSTQ